MNTVLFVNATIGFSENVFLVIISSPTGDLVTLANLQTVFGPYWLGFGLVVVPRHIVPDRGKVVTAQIFVQGRSLHSDMDRLSKTSLKPSRFYC